MFFGMPKPLAVAYSANGPNRSKRDCLTLPTSIDELVEQATNAAAAGASLFSFSARKDRKDPAFDPAVALSAAEAVKTALDGTLAVQLELHFPDRASIDLAGFERLLKSRQLDSCLIRLEQILPRDGDDEDEAKARDLLDLCDEFGVGVTLAFDKASDIEWFYAFRQYGVIPESCNALLFLLGEDGETPQSDPHALRPFLTALDKHYLTDKVKWSVAAFGQGELATLAAAIALGGHIAPGLAYNIHARNGEPFNSVQDQLSPLQDIAARLGRPTASGFEARTLLFGPR